MAFDFTTDSGERVAIPYSADELFTLHRRWNLSCPILDRIWDQYYGKTFTIASGDIAAFKNQIEELETEYLAEVVPKLKRERKVFSYTPAIEQGIIDKLLMDDPLATAMREIRELCALAISNNEQIRCSGD